MGKLSELPNIGKELELQLGKIGVKTPEQLKDAGTIQVFQKLHAMDPNACINTLYALEGAIQNIRWHQLEPGIKKELKHFFTMLQLSDNN